MNEFEIIKTYFYPLAKKFPGALSLLDDAALLDIDPDHQMVITNDILTAGVHFFENDPADLVARKSIRVNLSDLAAMGAEPLVYLLALSLPNTVDDAWLELFSNGLKQDQINYGISLIGGDTSSTPGPTSISITMLGRIRVNKALKKSNAKLGDDIWVSGNIGDAGVALKIIKGEVNVIDDKSKNYLFKRLHLPEPRLELGNNLIEIANSATDISDGLANDLNNICQASGFGAVVQGDSIPISELVSTLIKQTKHLKMSHIISGGDDYELVFTAPPEYTKNINTLSKNMGLKISKIGSIVEGKTIRIIDKIGHDLPLETEGYQHF